VSTDKRRGKCGVCTTELVHGQVLPINRQEEMSYLSRTTGVCKCEDLLSARGQGPYFYELEQNTNVEDALRAHGQGENGNVEDILPVHGQEESVNIKNVCLVHGQEESVNVENSPPVRGKEVNTKVEDVLPLHGQAEGIKKEEVLPVYGHEDEGVDGDQRRDDDEELDCLAPRVAEGPD
jgi:hypothetical protein